MYSHLLHIIMYCYSILLISNYITIVIISLQTHASPCDADTFPRYNLFSITKSLLNHSSPSLSLNLFSVIQSSNLEPNKNSYGHKFFPVMLTHFQDATFSPSPNPFSITLLLFLLFFYYLLYATNYYGNIIDIVIFMFLCVNLMQCGWMVFCFVKSSFLLSF